MDFLPPTTPLYGTGSNMPENLGLYRFLL